MLVAVREDDAYANLVLPQLLRERRIEGRDAAFTTELVGGTLRGLGSYDAVIDHLAGREPDAGVRDALRLGAHQLLAMRVPDHAAVDQHRRAGARTRVGHKPAGLHQRGDAPDRRARPRRLDGPARRLAGGAPLPPASGSSRSWPVALDRPDELEALLAADNDRPTVTLVARPGLSTVEELRTAPVSRRRAISPLGVDPGVGDPGDIPAVREGRAGVQDAGSQLVALALSRARVEGRDERWLDLCAGPGGKAALLAALATSEVPGCWPTSASRTARGWSRRRCAPPSGDVVAGDGTRPAVARRRPSTGCWWTRRARGWVPCGDARRAAGAVARKTSSDAGAPAARAAATAPSTRCGRGSGALRDLLAGGRGDRRGGARRCSPPDATRASRTRWPLVPGGGGRGVGPPRRAPSSCGRTGTAPTRCSWPCCAELGG